MAGFKNGAVIVSDSTNNPIGMGIDASLNLIWGGNFGTNPWQAGEIFTSPINNTYTADQFVWRKNGTGNVVVQKSGNVPSINSGSPFSTSSLQITPNVADITIDAADYYYMTAIIEGYDFQQIAQRTFTISFWVYASKTGTYCIAVNNGVDRFYVAEYAITSPNIWQYKTVTIAASPSAGTWNYTNGTGLQVSWIIAMGSNQQGSPNSWGTTEIRATTNQVNGMDNISNAFYIQHAKIDLGLTATVAQVSSASDVLAKAQRYYFKTFNQGVAPAQNIGSAIGALTYMTPLAGVQIQGQYLKFPVTMSATPIFTSYNPFAANDDWYNVDNATTSGSPSYRSAGQSGVYVLNPQQAADSATEEMVIHIVASSQTF